MAYGPNVAFIWSLRSLGFVWEDMHPQFMHPQLRADLDKPLGLQVAQSSPCFFYVLQVPKYVSFTCLELWGYRRFISGYADRRELPCKPLRLLPHNAGGDKLEEGIQKLVHQQAQLTGGSSILESMCFRSTGVCCRFRFGVFNPFKGSKKIGGYIHRPHSFDMATTLRPSLAACHVMDPLL